MENQNLSARIKRSLLEHHPSGFLLAAQLLLLILFAIVEGAQSQRALLSAFSALILLLIVWVVSRSPATNWIAWILAIPAFILSLLLAFIDNPTLLIISSLLEAVLYFYAAGSLIAYMMGDERVTADELYAAGATFTLLAWGYAYLFMASQTWVPGSFNSSLITDRPLTFVELLSLSFTNLTATGLGDALPVSSAARVIVMLEQFSGIGYVAVVVSRLVGLTIQQAQERKKL